MPNASVMPIRTSPLMAGTARLRALTRPKAASSMRLAAARISAPSGVGRMPSTCRVTSTVPSVRSRSSILRRKALGESPMRSAAERMLPQRASSRKVRTASQSGPPADELKSMCSFSGPPRFTIIGIRCPCDLHNLFVLSRLWQPEYAMTVHDRRTTRTAQALIGAQKTGQVRPGSARIDQFVAAAGRLQRDLSGHRNADAARPSSHGRRGTERGHSPCRPAQPGFSSGASPAAIAMPMAKP